MSRPLRVVVDDLREGTQLLSEEASRYVVKVHRKRAGDELELIDPRNGLFARHATVADDRLPQVSVETHQVEEAPQQDMALTLFVALGKTDKPEQAIRDATALGAASVVLVHTERSVAKSSGAQRSDRWLRIAEQVARQCERGRLPNVEGPIRFSELSDRLVPGSARLICAFHPHAVTLLDALSPLRADHPLEVFVGPEGGFSESEVNRAIQSGFQPVSLGPYVLRAELAVTAVLSIARAVTLQKVSHTS